MLAVAVARHLHTEGLAALDETGATGDLFVAHMPNKPDAAVCVMPTGGIAQRTRHPIDIPTIQILIRGAPHDARTPLQRADAIYAALAALDNALLDPGGPDEVWIIGCTPAQSGPIPMGQDELQRPEWSLNFELRVHNPTVHRPALA